MKAIKSKNEPKALPEKRRRNITKTLLEEDSEEKNFPENSQDDEEDCPCEENKKYGCSECKKRFRKKSDCDTQMRVHTREKPNECCICGKRFSQSANLQRHKKIHSDERPFKCKYKDCTYAAKRKDDLIQHINRTHLKIPAKKPKKVHICDTCSRRFPFLSALKRHLTSHEKIRPFSCDICSKPFKDKYQLSMHKKRVHRQEQTASSSKEESMQHAEQIQTESFQTPSTSAQATELIEFEEVASREMIFTPREAEEFLEHFNIDTEIMQMETSAQMELFSEIETEKNIFECFFCKERFADENSRKEHERNSHNFYYF
ncbi:endothelial zinc finger protein induced by tumor necrosis factor alpha-like [Centruroides vittatus]|uniref:endothelial zinc finger protein induced by tumor necrosis factor alpha-like n=1 Tax=Centruroides vittatus TaxID=120091 RepID=UPI00350EC6D2